MKTVDIGTHFDVSDNMDLDVDADGRTFVTYRNDDRIIILPNS